MRIYLIILCCLASCFWVGAQKSVHAESSYVERDTTDYMLALVSRYRNYEVQLIGDNGQAPLARRDIGLGVRARYKWINLELSGSVYEIPMSLNSITPSVIGVAARLFPESFAFKMDLQYTSLFHDVFDFIEQPALISQSSYILSGNLWGAYLFGENKVSLQAAYGFVDRQKASAGSFFVSGFGDYHYWRMQEKDFQYFPSFENPAFDHFAQLRLGTGAGYTYSWVILPQLVTNFMISGGLEYSLVHIEKNSTTRSSDYFTINPNIRAAGSLIYYSGPYFVGITGEYFPDFTIQAPFEFSKEYWWVKCTVGKKF